MEQLLIPRNVAHNLSILKTIHLKMLSAATCLAPNVSGKRYYVGAGKSYSVDAAYIPYPSNSVARAPI